VQFLAYLRLLKRHWKAALTAVVAPAVCFPLNFCPPWPDSTGATSCVIAAIISVVGVLVPYAFPTSRKKALARSIGAGIVAAVCLLVYIASWSSWVRNAEQFNDGHLVSAQVVIGTTFAISTQNLSEKELLRYHGFRVGEIYSSTSLMVTRLVLLSSFSAIFFFLTAAFGFTATKKRQA
jgi:hypothetical protein